MLKLRVIMVLAVVVMGLSCLWTVADAAPGSVEVHVSADSPVLVALTLQARIVAGAVVPKGRRGCLLTGVAPGKYVLVVSAPGYRSSSSTVTVPDGGEAEAWVRLEKFRKQDYRALGRVVGFVKNAAGAPVGDCLLVLLKNKALVGTATPQKKTGVYELEWYPPGVYTVLVIAKGYKTVDYHGVELRAGKSTRLDPVLAPE